MAGRRAAKVGLALTLGHSGPRVACDGRRKSDLTEGIIEFA